MAEETISAASPAGTQLDSLSANEFALEIEGERATGIFRISGLTPFKMEIKPSLTKMLRDPFKVVKMVQRDPQNSFNVWVRETMGARQDIVRPTRTLAVVALDDGVETRRWTINGAYIAEIIYSDFNTASSDLIEETLTIMYESIDDSVPGSD